MFVVVTGLPASGKSTLGRQLAAELDLTLLDKDRFLEDLFGDESVGDAQRARWSREADVQFRAAASSTQGAVLVSWWRRPGSTSTSGTPTAWLAELEDLVEVYCECPPELAVERFFERRRHPAHGDDRWTDRASAVGRFSSAASPLGIAPVTRVRTDQPIDPAAVAGLVSLSLGRL